MNAVDISVVIPVKKGERHLDDVLRMVFSQEIDAVFEVIIIDSGSIDKSPEIISRYPAKIYRIEESEFNHGLTRNLGISKAQGEYVILLSQDAVPYDNCWMSRLAGALMRDKNAAGAYSRQLPRRDSSLITRIRINRFFTSDKERRESCIASIRDYEKLSAKKKHRFCNFDNVSSCIRKSAWERMPFPKADFAEDLEWSKKVLEAGYKIIYEPSSIVYHAHEFSIRDWHKRTRINYSKLYFLFKIQAIDSFYKVFIFSAIYAFRDFCFLLKVKSRLKDTLSAFCLIPFFSLSCALGQYEGVRDSRRKKFINENTPGSS